MGGQDDFAGALQRALDAADMTQAELARQIPISASQVNRWVRGKVIPHRSNLKQINRVLDTDLTVAFEAAAPPHELYVSAPITGLADEHIAMHRELVAQVVEAAGQQVNGLYWPGEPVRSAEDLSPADIATEDNLKVLDHCEAFLFLQFTEVVRPSSAYVELGIALGLKKKVTIITQKDLHAPFMLAGFSAVAERIRYLPKARVYPVKDVKEAVRLIVNKDGRELLGLA